MKPTFPQPLQIQDVVPLYAETPHREVFERIKKGDTYCFVGTWGSAMNFYSWLKKLTNQLYPIRDYITSRINRNMHWEFNQRLVVKIANGQIDLANAPHIPWLKEFYDSDMEFYLPFADILGMNGAFQWYKNGIQFPGLDYKLHPFYGTYFPTRSEHLQLFDDWMTTQPPFRYAIDLGMGSGVLTHYMLKNGIEKVLASDINPNALYSVGNDLKRLKLEQRVELQHSNLFENLSLSDIPSIVVFNPPWIPDSAKEELDKSMYYHSTFFNDFFESAHKILPNGCSLVLLFSNFAQVAGVTLEHPIKDELNNFKRFALVERFEKRIKQKPSKRKNWLSEIRKREKVELWVLNRRD